MQFIIQIMTPSKVKGELLILMLKQEVYIRNVQVKLAWMLIEN